MFMLLLAASISAKTVAFRNPREWYKWEENMQEI